MTRFRQWLADLIYPEGIEHRAEAEARNRFLLMRAQ